MEGLRLGLLLSFAAAVPSLTAATLVADYRLERDLRSTVPGAPDLRPAGSPWVAFVPNRPFGVDRDLVQLPAGAGFTLSAPELVDARHYSVSVIVALATVDGYVSLLDVQDPALSGAVYLYNGALMIEPALLDDAPSVAAREFVELSFVKDGPELRYYVNGRLELQGTDPDHALAVAPAGAWNILRRKDDSYAPGGQVARIRIFNGALTPAEVAALERDRVPAPAPIPASGARLIADHRLEGDLTSEVAGAPDLTITGTAYASTIREPVQGANRRALLLPTGAGLRLDAAGVRDRNRYTLSLNYQPTSNSGYLRVIDPRPTSAQNGFYTLDGRPLLFPGVDPGVEPLPTNAYTALTLVKDGPTIRVHAGSKRIIQVLDPEGTFDLALSDPAAFSLLRSSDGSGAWGGKVARVRLWDGSLNDAEVAALRPFEPPTSDPDGGARLVADFRFQGSLDNAVAGGPTLSSASPTEIEPAPELEGRPIGKFAGFGELEWKAPVLPPTNRYTVVLGFSPDNDLSWQAPFQPGPVGHVNGWYFLNQDGQNYPLPYNAPGLIRRRTFSDLAFVTDDLATRIYKDGVPVYDAFDTGRWTHGFPEGKWTLGSLQGGAYAMPARWARVRIFDGALTDAEIAALEPSYPRATVQRFPNLVVSDVRAPAQARLDEPFEVRYRIANAGTLPAVGPWWDSVTLVARPDAPTGEELVLGSFFGDTVLAPGASLEVTRLVSISAFGPAGSLYLRIQTDATDAVAESAEVDNRATSAVAIDVPFALTFSPASGAIREDHPGGQFSGYLYRNGDFSRSLVVQLSSDDTTEVRTPATVEIAAGLNFVAVPLTVVPDRVNDGPQTARITATAAGYLPAVGEVYVEDADSPPISVTITPNRIREGQSAEVLLRRTGPLRPATLVTLFAPGWQIEFPPTVNFPADATEVRFTVSALDDSIPEANNAYTLHATATGYLPGEASLTIDDDDVPQLRLAFSASEILENAGPQAVRARILRDRAGPRALTVELRAEPTGVLILPAQVVLEPGETTAYFDIGVVDDTRLNGSRLVGIIGRILDSATGTVITEIPRPSISVHDDESAHLDLALDASLVGPDLDPAARATLTRRNLSTVGALTVQLISSLPERAKAPESVVIPPGQASVIFPIRTLAVAPGSPTRDVTFTATAPGIAPAQRALVVAGESAANLEISALDAPTSAPSGQPVRATIRLANGGFSPGGSGAIQRFYWSTDAAFDAADGLAGQVVLESDLPPRGTLSQSVQFRAPAELGTYWILAVADAEDTVRELREDDNVRVLATPVNVVPGYTGTVKPGFESAAPDTPVPLAGTAVRVGTSEPAADVPIEIAVVSRGIERRLAARTDNQGRFAVTFEPLPGEAGRYAVAALHPGSPFTTAQAEFKLLGLRPQPLDGATLVEGTSLTLASRLANPVDLPVSGLRASVISAPRGVTITPSLATDRIAADGSIEFGLAVTAAMGAENGTARIRFLSAEGAAGDLFLPVFIQVAQASLAATPNPVDGAMRRGEQSMVYVRIRNTGGLATGPLSVLAPSAPWLKVSSPARLAPLVPGQETEIALQLLPAADLPLGPYAGSIVVTDSRIGLSVPFTFQCVSERIGALAVEVVDEFTYYAAGAPRPTNATVTLYDANTRELVATRKTEPDGRVVFPELREAYYDLSVTADEHTPYSSTLLVRPGKTNSITAFLSRQTVRYVFTVVPTEIEDRTRIEITTVFETFVPIPVLTVDPPYVDLGAWSGVSTQINVTLENHGLIAAPNVRFSLPEHPDVTFSSPITEIGTLPARTAIQVPILIQRKGAGTLASAATAPLAGRGSLVALAGPGSDGTPMPKTGSRRALLSTRRPAGGGTGPCLADMSFTFDLECGSQVNTYAVPLRFDKLPGQCDGSGWDAPWDIAIGGGGGGGPASGEGCFDCSTPGIISPPRFISPPRSCDPCLAGIGLAIASCAIGVEIQEAASTAACAWEGVKCVAGLASDGFNYETISGCAANAGACVGGAAGAILQIPECIEPAGACFEAGGGGGGGEGGAGGDGDAALKSIRRPAGTAEPKLPAAAEPFFRQQRRGVALLKPLLYWLGDPAWLDVTDKAAWQRWFDAFNASTAAGSDAARRISPAERAQILLVPLPAPITTAVAERLLDRWNRSLDAWSRGFYNASQLPAGESQDIISADQFVALAKDAVAANEAAMHEGYPDAFSATILAGEEFIARADSTGGGVCARVKIKIEQEAVITRDGFNASLEIFNDTDQPLGDIGVELRMESASGQESTRLFGIRPPVLTGLSAVDGSGQIAPRTSGKASWILIPTSEAAPEGPVTHLVGGTLRYRQGDLVVNVPLAASGIRVLPNAALTLKYFHERDVIADDPFTDEIEPSIPYSLAVMVANSGRGAARNVRISSAQPRIVENKKGLLVDFKIVATEVAGESVTPSLTAVFGDIPPGENRIGRWLMTSTLQGLFTEYSASFEHLDGLGDKRLSLIQGVEIHELIRVVRADRTFEDHRPDFLANDVPDFDDLPDALHLSQGTVQPVLPITNPVLNAAPDAGRLSVELSATFPARWGYLRMPEPSQGRLVLREVRRADGSLLSMGTNVWITDRTFAGLARKPVYEHKLHLLDFAGTGPYRLTYVFPNPPDATAPASRVLPLPELSPLSIEVRWEGTDAGGSDIAAFDIEVSEDGGPFQPWLVRTAERGAIYLGTTGKRYAFRSLAIDAAGNRETPPAAPDATTTAGAPNAAPVIAAIDEIVIDEGQTLDVRLSATDADAPGQSLTWSLGTDAPAGARLDRVTGQLTWPTGEGTGPSTNRFTVQVRDSGSPSLSASASVTVVVREVNAAPTLEPLARRAVNELRTVAFQAVASDADLPANVLRFSLVDPPAGAAITADGRFSWTPTRFQGPSTNVVRIQVTDDGTPARSATRDVPIVVRDTEGAFDVSIGSQVTRFPPDPTVPLRLDSGLDLSSIAFALEVRASTPVDLILEPVAAELATAQVVPDGPNRFQVRLVAAPGEVLQGNRTLAEFRFRTADLGRSALLWLQPVAVSGTRSNGERAPAGRGSGGRIVLLGIEPVLEIDPGTPMRLQVHAPPGVTYQLQSSTGLGEPGSTTWQTVREFRQDNLSAPVDLIAAPEAHRIYRLRR